MKFWWANFIQRDDKPVTMMVVCVLIGAGAMLAGLKGCT